MKSPETNSETPAGNIESERFAKIALFGPFFSTIGRGAMAGGVCGYFLVTLALGVFTQGNLSGLVGLMTGLPLGMGIGIITAVARSRERNRTDTIFWIAVAVVLIALVGVVAAIMLLHAQNS
jgi:hypothetical protein